MSTTTKLIAKYGNPLINQKAFEQKHMALCTYTPKIKLALPILGASVYCNKDMIKPLTNVLEALIDKELAKEIKTNDQCFCVRSIRGSQDISVHSWGMAIDFNVNDNPLGMTKQQAKAKGLTPFTEAFDQVWRDHGFVCGIDFTRKDGMHYEYTKFL